MHQSAYTKLGEINVEDFSFTPTNQILFADKDPDLSINDYVDPSIIESDESTLVAARTGDYAVSIRGFAVSEAAPSALISINIARKRQQEQESPIETYQTFGGGLFTVKPGEVVQFDADVILPLGEGESVAFFLAHNLGTEIQIPVNVVGLQINMDRL